MAIFDKIEKLKTQLNNTILGQERLINRLLVALLSDGHLLVEGLPGLGKTSAVKALGNSLEGDFHRIQFTPDLLPADLTGTEIFMQNEGSFRFQKGPLFHNLVLADEINRAPAKVQSALLEAMAERQITVGRTTYELPALYLVMATQNPIEQDGTYPLPEAQRDRFLLHVNVGYPSAQAELDILRGVRTGTLSEGLVSVTQDDIFAARRAVLDQHMAPEVERYIVDLVAATRDAAPFDAELADWIRYGASTRAVLAFDRASRALSWLDGRDYVSPEDIQSLAPDILRHRLILHYEAEARGITADACVTRLISVVGAP